MTTAASAAHEVGTGQRSETPPAATPALSRRDAFMEHERQLLEKTSANEFATHFRAWMDFTLAELEALQERCDGQLKQNLDLAAFGDAAPAGGGYWRPETLVRHCNLSVGPGKLLHRGRALEAGEHIGWRDLLAFPVAIAGLKGRMPAQAAELDGALAALASPSGPVFEPGDLATITRALETKLQEKAAADEDDQVMARLASEAAALQPEVSRLEAHVDQLFLNGDIERGEAECEQQLAHMERQLALLTEQYAVIDRRYTESAAHERRRRWHIFRMANRDIASVMEAKRRDQDMCRGDLDRVKEQMANYDLDHRAQQRRYRKDIEESDKHLEAIKDRQQSVWNAVRGIFAEFEACQQQLQELAGRRLVEVERRMRIEESESRRRGGHSAFISVAAAHMTALQQTVDNANKAHDFAARVNEFVLDESDNITARFDRGQRQLRARVEHLRRQHYATFTDFGVKAGRLLDRKELRLGRVEGEAQREESRREIAVDALNPAAKGHADAAKALREQARDLRGDIAELKERVRRHERQLRKEVLDHMGQLPPPADLVARISELRHDKVLDCREAIVAPRLPDEGKRQVREERDSIKASRSTALSIKTARRAHGAGAAATGGMWDGTGKLMPRAPATVGGANTARGRRAPDEPLTPHALTAGDAAEREAPVSAQRGNFVAAAVAGAAAGVGGSLPPLGGADGLTTQQALHHQQIPASAASPALPPIDGLSGANHPDDPNGGLRDGTLVRARFAYEAGDADELGFFRGENFVVVSRAADPGWYIGVKGDQQGVFPGNYVEEVEA